MNPIVALFWKEARESAYKVAACAGLAMIVGLVFSQWDFAPADVNVVSHSVGLFGAVLMGMDAIARERSRMTLPFLLCRPLPTWKILIVKFTVGAVGLLVVLAAYWGGVFIGMHDGGGLATQLGFYSNRALFISPHLQPEEILEDVGYARAVLLWLFIYLIPYGVTVLVSTLTDNPVKAAMTSLMAAWVVLMAAWVVLFPLACAWNVAPKSAVFYFRLVFSLGVDHDAGILRAAFDPSLLLARFAAANVLGGGVLLCACRVFRVQASKRFQWTVGVLALISGIFVMVQNVAQSHHRRTPVAPEAPIGSLPYNMNVADLELKDGLAVVLLEQGISVVDVADPTAPVEIGWVQTDGWQLERMDLSGSRAYVWGEVRDSVGVAVFDLSRPDHPLKQAVNLLYPVEKGPTPWLRRIPRLVGWAVWEGHLYAGLLRDRLLELHSFDVRVKGPPRLVHVFPIEETRRHLWNNEWEMRIAGPHGFLTLGHEFVILNLADPGQPKAISRTPLRRFGRSVKYEKSVQEVYEGLTSGAYKKRLVQEFENAMGGSGQMFLRTLKSRGLQDYMIDAPPALGPLTVGNDNAYIERHLPREIAVVDISDPGKPVEVNYIPRTYLPRRLTIEGEFAYALRRSAIQTYVWTSYGTLAQREKLGIGDSEEYLRNTDIVYEDIGISHLARDMFILKGDHIYALLNNHLAIFENPRKKE
ncbi:MAG: ABC transporter permease subunit [Candidatus Latescibacteria bacterium]|nr:ABC transporter permease subunit [Candidatus Latescibacterota bacterium]